MEIIDISSDNIPIYYDNGTREVIYKDNRVLLQKIVQGMKSTEDRVLLSRNLYMEKTKGFISFGCLTLTLEKAKILINKYARVN